MLNTIMDSNDDDEVTFIELKSVTKEEFLENDSADVLAHPNSDEVPANEAPRSNEINVDESHEQLVDNNDSREVADKPVESRKKGTSAVARSKNVRKSKRVLKVKKMNKSSKASVKKKIKSKLRGGRKRNRVDKSSSDDKKSSSDDKKPSSDDKKTKCEYPRLCPGCGHAYKTKQSFWNHKQRCPMLPQNRRTVVVDENGVPIEGAVNGGFVPRKEYICAHCERRYRKKYNLREHLKNMCRGKPCSKGRLQCWEAGCSQAFYKYVDLVQHVTLQHDKDLQIQKLQFSSLAEFNAWKTQESNSKFMYARKITGSKRFSNTKYHYFVCQFNHRNEKKNSKRKTSRRKKDSLVVPNYNCPSRIMVKECDGRIYVTYISSHNHELNLSNVKYQPLEKETRTYIKTLLQLGVTPQRIVEHLQEGVGQPDIDTFLATKQRFLTINRVKRMESKLRSAKNRAEPRQPPPPRLTRAGSRANAAANDSDTVVPDDCDVTVDAGAPASPPSSLSSSYTPAVADIQAAAVVRTPAIEHQDCDDDVIRSIESNLKRLKGYVHKNSIKEKLSDRISKMIQELCDECESMENAGPAASKKTRALRSSARRTRRSAAVANAQPAATNSVPAPPAPIVAPASLTDPVTAVLPASQHQPQILQPVVVQQLPQQQPPQQQPPPQLPQQQPPQQIPQQQLVQTHQLHHQPAVDSLGQVPVVSAVVTALIRHEAAVVASERTFSPAISDATDLLKPIFQPFNINLLFLKSIDRFISERDRGLLERVDECFVAGWLYDAVVNSFLSLICRNLVNVLAADTSITEYVQVHQKVPDVWHCFNWNNIDTIFIPCNPSKKQWILMVVLVKQLEVQILDPAGCYEEAILNIYKKHEAVIRCWYEVLRNFLGIAQWNVTSPPHTKHPDPVNSGVLVCWYVSQYINKRNLMDHVDLDDSFRRCIFNTIVNNSSAM